MNIYVYKYLRTPNRYNNFTHYLFNRNNNFSNNSKNKSHKKPKEYWYWYFHYCFQIQKYIIKILK